jgi:hypothetical protein
MNNSGVRGISLFLLEASLTFCLATWRSRKMAHDLEVCLCLTVQRRGVSRIFVPMMGIDHGSLPRASIWVTDALGHAMDS